MTTPALKDIGRISARLGNSPLSKSAIWYQPVDKIQPVQLAALVRRFTELGQRDLVETAIDIAQAEIQQAVAHNEIGVPDMLSYKRPLRTFMTSGEFSKGLTYLGPARAAAITFALETDMDAMGVSMLTHRRLSRMGELTEIAKHCLQSYPRHLQTAYVFWENVDGKAMPLFGLDAAIFDAFGMVWAELAFGYANMILSDGDADRAVVQRLV